MHNTSNKKVLSFFDITIMTVASNFGIRWLAVAAGIGPSSLVYWFIGALFFFMPLAIICARLSKLYPEEGGLYAWTKNVLGEKSGFIVAWLYWVNNIFFYPAILIFLASNFAYFLGRPELAANQTYITLCVLIAFWGVVIFATLGLKVSRYIINFGGIIGLIIPVALLIGFATAAYIKFGGTATSFNPHSLIPNDKLLGNLSSLSLIMFAMAGIEVIPTFANAVKNVKRDLYLGLLLGALLTFLLYTLGTISMNVLATPESIQKASGLMEVFTIIDAKFGMVWLTRTVAFLINFAEFAAIIVWLLAPVIMFFKCTPKGILPNWMHKTNKAGTPVNAIFFQGALVSLIMLVTTLLPSVRLMYQILVLMSTILYFIPYLFLVFVFIKSIRLSNSNKIFGNLLAYGVFFSVLFGILVSFMPTADLKTTKDTVIYELELVTGPLILVVLGYLLYRLRKVK